MEVQFENIQKSYKDKKVLKGICVTMGTGVYGLLGPNGAGTGICKYPAVGESVCQLGRTYDAVFVVYPADVYHCSGICRGMLNWHGPSDFKLQKRQTQNCHSKAAQYIGCICYCIIGFISSRMKNQMGTVGVSLAILFINVGLAAMGDTVTQRFQPLIDFGLANVTLIKEFRTVAQKGKNFCNVILKWAWLSGYFSEVKIHQEQSSKHKMDYTLFS